MDKKYKCKMLDKWERGKYIVLPDMPLMPIEFGFFTYSGFTAFSFVTILDGILSENPLRPDPDVWVESIDENRSGYINLAQLQEMPYPLDDSE